MIIKQDLRSLYSYIVKKELIAHDTLSKVISAAKKTGLSPLFYLAQENLIPPNELTNLTAEFFNLPIIDISDYTIQDIPIHLIPAKLLQQTNVLPIKQHITHIDIAMVDPLDTKAIEEIKFHSGKNINILIAQYDKLQRLIKRINTQHHTTSLNKLISQESIKTTEYDFLSENDEPLIRFVNNIIEEAINNQASDIHFEPYENYFRVRFRQDGILNEIANPPQYIAQRLAARIKIMANLDISERRIPQDGRCKITINKSKDINLRINTCPTLHGEKIVLRILDNDSAIIQIDQLGLNAKQKDDFFSAINKPQGLILVTGPTGSGKTVTLYATLNYLNKITKNILTIEDPIEINLPGINQVSVNLKAKLTFAKTLRAFLRQDPDIIMLGEIRDLETAEIAIKAAHTGHLVLSTLHTNSAIEAISRLHNMGIATYNIISSLILVTAQRLTRKLCPYCKTTHEITSTTREQLSLPPNIIIFKASGCKQCVNGYRGRIAAHETIPIHEKHHNLIFQPESNLITFLKQQKITSLQESAIEKVSQGLTSLDEISRTIFLKNYA